MTPTQQLAELKLGGSLERWVSDRRTRGESWRSIARDLHTETGIAVSDESLRQWFSTSGGRWDSEGTYLERES